ncbi:mechanosensitive ion channel family protein [Sphingosinicella sp. CPCC 101087]|uniref:mechanosensitive ion channel family protein n=1 Tax=Sphingosinicella sp. CPCC 101087 TaxID=2497754 RepID=UPI00101CBC29|nr:mechanosensitive ion channel domain-containing protein [Sphingosinicella sp. CPCC 101087]
MSGRTAGAGALNDRLTQRWHEIADWVAANSLDLLLASLAAAFIMLVLLGLRRFGYKLIRDHDEAGEVLTVSWRTVFGRALAKTSLFFIVMTALKLVVSQADAPPFLQRLTTMLFTVSAALQAAIWGRELVLGFIEHRLRDEPDQGRLSSAVGIIRLFVTIALFAIAFIVILDNLGVNVTGLVAGLGIGGIAIGLAAQGIFSDLFAALSIIFDRPFRRGDTITFGTTTGTVEQIGLKTTRIRSLGGEEVVISNAKLLEQQLQNWALLKERRIVMHFGVIYQTPPDVLAQIPHELKTIVSGLSRARFDRCHAFQFGASSIDFELVFHVTSPEFDVSMQVRQGIMLGMIRRFVELGVEFAYPTQTTFTAAPDGKMIMPYPPMGLFAVEPREEQETEPPEKA